MVPRFERVAGPYWTDKPTAIVGAGPSLSNADLSPLAGHVHAVAVTAAIWKHQWADIGFGVDFLALITWWQRFATIPMPIWWGVPNNKTPGDWPTETKADLHLLHIIPNIRLSLDEPDGVCGGGTSGFAALDFAVSRKLSRGLIVLFGFDYCADEAGNWHYAEHEYGLDLKYTPEPWKVWASYFNYIEFELERLGCRVVNASPKSLIRAFPKVSVDEGIDMLLREAKCTESVSSD